MYADNELSAAEKLHVEEYLKANPPLQVLFDQICRLKLEHEKIVFPDKEYLYAEQIELSALTFEPDFTIAYPFKDALYKKVPVRKLTLRLSMGVAASLFFIIGLSLLLNKSETASDENLSKHQSLKSPVLVQNHVEPIVLNDTKISTIIHRHPSNKIISVIESDVPVNDLTALHSDQGEEEIIVEALPETSSVQSNLSDEALKAAASRTADDVKMQSSNISINTDILIEASNRTESRQAFRGLVRKITRRIFKEKEISSDQKSIQVSNFVIPVSNKQ